MELQRRTLLHIQTKDKQSARKDILHIQNLNTKRMLAQIRRDREELKEQKDKDDLLELIWMLVKTLMRFLVSEKVTLPRLIWICTKMMM